MINSVIATLLLKHSKLSVLVWVILNLFWNWRKCCLRILN